MPESGPISIYSWNVNGLNATVSKGKFQEFMADAKPDIICLNESKMTYDKIEKKFRKEIPEGYEQHWNCSKDKKGYSGVAIFTKFKPISVTHDIGIDKHDREGRVLTMEFDKFYLVSCYTPNAGEGLKRLQYRVGEWDKDFFKYLQSLEDNGKFVILTGDLNVAHKDIDIYDTKNKHKNPGFSPEERRSFGDFLKNQKYVDTFRNLYPSTQKYSFWTVRFQNLRLQNKGWRLDYFLIKDSEMPIV